MRPPLEEIARIHAELDRLSLAQIRQDLANGRWRGEKREVAERYLEEKEMARSYRFTAEDRNIQKWILAFAVGSFVAILVGWLMQ